MEVGRDGRTVDVAHLRAQGGHRPVSCDHAGIEVGVQPDPEDGELHLLTVYHLVDRLARDGPPSTSTSVRTPASLRGSPSDDNHVVGPLQASVDVPLANCLGDRKPAGKGEPTNVFGAERGT